MSIATDPNAETVRTWIRTASKATPRAVTPAPAAAKPTLEAEIEALRRKIRELEEELDTLHPTARYLERAIVGLAQQPFPRVPPVARPSRSRSAQWLHARPPSGHHIIPNRPRRIDSEQQKASSQPYKAESIPPVNPDLRITMHRP